MIKGVIVFIGGTLVRMRTERTKYVCPDVSHGTHRPALFRSERSDLLICEDGHLIAAPAWCSTTRLDQEDADRRDVEQ